MAGAVRVENVENYLKKSGDGVCFSISTAKKRTTNHIWQDAYLTHTSGIIVTPQKKSKVVLETYGNSNPFCSFMAGFLYVLTYMDMDGFKPLFYHPAYIERVQMVQECIEHKFRSVNKVPASEWKLSDYPYLSLYTPFKGNKPQHFKSCWDAVVDGYELKAVEDYARKASEAGVTMPWDNPATFLPYLKTLVQFKGYSRYETDVQIVPTTRDLFYNYAISFKRI